MSLSKKCTKDSRRVSIRRTPATALNASSRYSEEEYKKIVAAKTAASQKLKQPEKVTGSSRPYRRFDAGRHTPTWVVYPEFLGRFMLSYRFSYPYVAIYNAVEEVDRIPLDLFWLGRTCMCATDVSFTLEQNQYIEIVVITDESGPICYLEGSWEVTAGNTFNINFAPSGLFTVN